jgi:Galactoside-binding lectin
MKNGQWQEEERYGLCRVKSGETFEIIILAELQHYKIAVNGHHLGVFRHRMPLSMVNYINVNGEVTLDHILLEQDLKSAQDQMVMSQITATQIGYPRMPINLPPHVMHQQQSHIQIHHQQPQVQVHQMFQQSIPGQVHTQMHVAPSYQHPTAPPPPYFSSQQPHSVNSSQMVQAKSSLYHFADNNINNQNWGNNH